MASQQTFHELFDMATALYRAERYSEALPLLRKCTRYAPLRLQALVNLMQAHVKLNQYKRAKKYARQALRTPKPSPYVIVVIAQTFRLNDDLKQATALLSESLSQHPDFAPTWLESAYTQHALQNHRKAQQHAQRALEHSPLAPLEIISAHSIAGDASIGNDDWGKALAHFEVVLAKTNTIKNSAEAHYRTRALHGKATVLLSRGVEQQDSEIILKATALFREAITLEPRDGRLPLDLARTLHILGRCEQARPWLAMAEALLGDTSEVRFEQAVNAADTLDCARATELHTSILIDPTTPESLRRKSLERLPTAYAQMGDAVACLRACEEAEAANIRSPMVANAHYLALVLQEHKDAALAALTEALQHHPEDYALLTNRAQHHLHTCSVRRPAGSVPPR